MIGAHAKRPEVVILRGETDTTSLSADWLYSQIEPQLDHLQNSATAMAADIQPALKKRSNDT